MPPPISLVSPAVAPLNSKERAGVALSRRWANRNEMPHAGEDGYVRFLFGATLPTVVCAPLQVCNLALQPGEIVNNVNLGDSVRWKITPSISGSGRNADHAPHHQAHRCRADVVAGYRDEPAHLRREAGEHAILVDAARRLQLPG